MKISVSQIGERIKYQDYSRQQSAFESTVNCSGFTNKTQNFEQMLKKKEEILGFNGNGYFCSKLVNYSYPHKMSETNIIANMNEDLTKTGLILSLYTSSNKFKPTNTEFLPTLNDIETAGCDKDKCIPSL
jgi:hypothetical protein